LWDLAPVEGTPSELAQLVDAIKRDSPPASGAAMEPTQTPSWAPPLAVSPVAIAAWHRREAGLWIAEGKPELALVHLDHALKAVRDSWMLHWQRGVLRESLGQLAEAEADFREVLRLDPDCDTAQEALDRVSR
jgi:Flp pilus assembly protein TadD